MKKKYNIGHFKPDIRKKIDFKNHGHSVQNVSTPTPTSKILPPRNDVTYLDINSGIDRKNNISSRRFFQIVKEFTQLCQQLRSNILSRADSKNITSPISSQTDSINCGSFTANVFTNSDCRTALELIGLYYEVNLLFQDIVAFKTAIDKHTLIELNEIEENVEKIVKYVENMCRVGILHSNCLEFGDYLTILSKLITQFMIKYSDDRNITYLKVESPHNDHDIKESDKKNPEILKSTSYDSTSVTSSVVSSLSPSPVGTENVSKKFVFTLPTITRVNALDNEKSFGVKEVLGNSPACQVVKVTDVFNDDIDDSNHEKNDPEVATSEVSQEGTIEFIAGSKIEEKSPSRPSPIADNFNNEVVSPPVLVAPVKTENNRHKCSRLKSIVRTVTALKKMQKSSEMRNDTMQTAEPQSKFHLDSNCARDNSNGMGLGLGLQVTSFQNILSNPSMQKPPPNPYNSCTVDSVKTENKIFAHQTSMRSLHSLDMTPRTTNMGTNNVQVESVPAPSSFMLDGVARLASYVTTAVENKELPFDRSQKKRDIELDLPSHSQASIIDGYKLVIDKKGGSGARDFANIDATGAQEAREVFPEEENFASRCLVCPPSRGGTLFTRAPSRQKDPSSSSPSPSPAHQVLSPEFSPERNIPIPRNITYDPAALNGLGTTIPLTLVPNLHGSFTNSDSILDDQSIGRSVASEPLSTFADHFSVGRTQDDGEISIDKLTELILSSFMIDGVAMNKQIKNDYCNDIFLTSNYEDFEDSSPDSGLLVVGQRVGSARPPSSRSSTSKQQRSSLRDGNSSQVVMEENVFPELSEQSIGDISLSSETPGKNLQYTDKCNQKNSLDTADHLKEYNTDDVQFQIDFPLDLASKVPKHSTDTLNSGQATTASKIDWRLLMLPHVFNLLLHTLILRSTMIPQEREEREGMSVESNHRNASTPLNLTILISPKEIKQFSSRETKHGAISSKSTSKRSVDSRSGKNKKDYYISNDAYCGYDPCMCHVKKRCMSVNGVIHMDSDAGYALVQACDAIISNDNYSQEYVTKLFEDDKLSYRNKLCKSFVDIYRESILDEVLLTYIDHMPTAVNYVSLNAKDIGFSKHSKNMDQPISALDGSFDGLFRPNANCDDVSIHEYSTYRNSSLSTTKNTVLGADGTVSTWNNSVMSSYDQNDSKVFVTCNAFSRVHTYSDSDVQPLSAKMLRSQNNTISALPTLRSPHDLSILSSNSKSVSDGKFDEPFSPNSHFYDTNKKVLSPVIEKLLSKANNNNNNNNQSIEGSASPSTRVSTSNNSNTTTYAVNDKSSPLQLDIRSHSIHISRPAEQSPSYRSPIHSRRTYQKPIPKQSSDQMSLHEISLCSNVFVESTADSQIGSEFNILDEFDIKGKNMFK